MPDDQSVKVMPEETQLKDRSEKPLTTNYSTNSSPLEKPSVNTTRQKDETSNNPKIEHAVTDSEANTLPLTADSLPLAVIITIVIGGAERFAFYAFTAPLQNYIQNPPGNYALPGALGLGQATATAINNAFRFLSFLTPLFIGILSDTWLGRYNALISSMVLVLCGAFILLMTSLPVALDRGAGPGGLVVSMVLIAFGVGGIKATFPPFLGDQYTQTQPRRIEKRNGQKALTNKRLTFQMIYSISFWVTNLASLSCIPSTFLETKFAFWTAYLLGFAAIIISLALLLCFSSKFVKVAPEGNMLLQASKVISCSVKSGFRLDNAKSSYQASHHKRMVPWADEFVDEVKMTLRTCRVLLSITVFSLCMGQMVNNLVSQAGQMELHGVPNDMIQALSGIAVVVLGPPIQGLDGFLAKRRVILGPMLRIALAFLFCAAGMAFSAGVQQLIYEAPPCFNAPLTCKESMGGSVPNRINVWVQTPLYFILGTGEILGYVTVDEYAYANSPQGGKAVVQAFKQLANCLGSVLGLAISPVSRDPYLVVMYASLAAAMVVTTGVFWYFFGKYDRPKTEETEESQSS